MILARANHRQENRPVPALQHQPSLRVTLTEHGTAGLGGTGCAVAGVSALDHDMAARLRVIDADRKTTTDLPTGAVILLSGDGTMSKILAERANYSYLRGDAVPSYLTPWETDQGLLASQRAAVDFANF
jgi:hypothetical protein